MRKSPVAPNATLGSRDHPGFRPLIEAGATGGTGRDLAQVLAALKAEAENSTAPAWQALLASAIIGQDAWERAYEAGGETADIPAGAPVAVPWWVIEQITLAMADCLDRKDEVPFDRVFSRAFGVGRSGQGERSAKETVDLALRDYGLAREVALELQICKKLDRAYKIVGQRWNVCERTLKKIWAKHGERVKGEVSLTRVQPKAV